MERNEIDKLIREITEPEQDDDLPPSEPGKFKIDTRPPSEKNT